MRFSADRNGRRSTLVRATGQLSASTGFLKLTAQMAGPIVDGNTNFDVWGFNRGSANDAPFQGESNVNFDAVVGVTAQPNGAAAGAITLIPGGTVATLIPRAAIQINGAQIEVAVPTSPLPPTGSVAAAGFVWNLWPRTGVGGPQMQVAGFIPENAMAPFLPSP
jgi:hypothetical protein